MPITAISDDEVTKKLIGTWQYSYTNGKKVTGLLLYDTYKPNNTVSWYRTIFKGDRSLPATPADGIWRIEHGNFITAVTNIPSGSHSELKETRDEIILVTDSQFTYPDEKGIVKKVIRTQK